MNNMGLAYCKDMLEELKEKKEQQKKEEMRIAEEREEESRKRQKKAKERTVLIVCLSACFVLVILLTVLAIQNSKYEEANSIKEQAVISTPEPTATSMPKPTATSTPEPTVTNAPTQPLIVNNNTSDAKVEKKYEQYNVKESTRYVYGDTKQYDIEQVEKDLQYLVYGRWESDTDGHIIEISEKEIDGNEYKILNANMSYAYYSDFDMSTFYLSIEYEYANDSGTRHTLCLDSGLLFIDNDLYEVCDREMPWSTYARYNAIGGLSATDAESVVDSVFCGTWTAADGTSMTFGKLTIDGRIYQVIDVEEIVYNNYNVNMNIVYLDDPETIHNVYYGSAGRIYVGDKEYSDKVVESYDFSYDYSDNDVSDWNNSSDDTSFDEGLSEEEMLLIAMNFIDMAMYDTVHAGEAYEVKSAVGAEPYLGNTFVASFKVKIISKHHTGTLKVYVREGFFGDYEYEKASFY